MAVIGKVFQLTPIKRSQIYLAIYNRKDEIFNIDIVNEHVKKCVDSGLENFTKIFSSIDLIDFINCNSKVDEYFKCLFLKGNMAWISKDGDNHYRYFTRSRAGVTFSLDCIDLFSVYLNAGFRKTINTMNKMFGISFSDGWKVNQEQKYETNKFIIEDETVLKNYPNLYSIIKKHIGILQIINEVGDSNLIGKSLQCNNEAVFFSSTRYIKNHYDVKYSTSVINQVINVFSVLGLINKVSEENIPTEYINLSKNRMTIDKCRYNHVSFYTIPNILDVLEKAEERAIILNKNSIKYYTMTQYVVKRVFGDDFANEIYVQKVYGGRSKCKAKAFKDEKELIRHLFNVSIINYGFASKEILRNNTEMSKKLFNQFWLELTNSVNHTTVKPNKLMKKKLQLQTNETVIIVKDIYTMAIF